ncbi:MAG TPA: arylamine N-acetyltransferase [Pirellulaceae bacterium]|nr:arylamine N-acetyltransferase [Pirellulaceae bacterium]
MEPVAVEPVDLDAYFARIGYTGAREPTLANLQAIHLAHATQVPFENLDILLGKSIKIDLPSLQQKIVQQRRGGYCFEQNLLLAAVLEQLGFRVTRLSARVRFMVQHVLPRTHTVLKVEIDGQSWLADVGFGGWGLLQPIALQTEELQRQFLWQYRLRREGDYWVLSAPVPETWIDLYAFTMEPHLPVDYEPANWFVSTHPDSIFVRGIIAQRALPEERWLLRGHELTVVRAGGQESRILAGNDELLSVLAKRFLLDFPPGTEFRAESV